MQCNRIAQLINDFAAIDDCVGIEKPIETHQRGDQHASILRVGVHIVIAEFAVNRIKSSVKSLQHYN